MVCEMCRRGGEGELFKRERVRVCFDLLLLLTRSDAIIYPSGIFLNELGLNGLDLLTIDTCTYMIIIDLGQKTSQE